MNHSIYIRIIELDVSTLKLIEFSDSSVAIYHGLSTLLGKFWYSQAVQNISVDIRQKNSTTASVRLDLTGLFDFQTGHKP